MKKLMSCIMVIPLIMLLISCATTSQKTIVPELVFPKFPQMELADEGVTVSEDWIVRLAEYKILIEETEKNYNDIKSLLMEEKK